MANRVALLIGIVAVVSVAGVYFALNARLSERDAKDAAEDAARKQLLAEPAKFVQCQSVRLNIDWATASTKDKMAAASAAVHGGHGGGSQVVETTLKNTSPYAVADIRGNVEYRANGRLIATVPASAAGMLLADHAAPLTVTANEIADRADQKETVFVVTSVGIVAGR